MNLQSKEFFVLALLITYVAYVVFKTARHSSDSDQLVPKIGTWWGVSAGLFTLFGGGEIVTLSSLGYLYGWAAVSLVVGYSISFAVLGFMVSKIDPSRLSGFVSLPDFIGSNFGNISKHLTFVVSFAAFFALLVLQFTVGGSLLSEFSGLNYNLIIAVIGATTCSYLLFGRYRAVQITDQIQGIAMLALGIAMLIALEMADSPSGEVTKRATSSMPSEMFISLVVTGLFVAASSADVWQRLCAATSPKSQRLGGVLGGLGLLLLGIVFTAAGVIARKLLGDSADPNTIINALVSSSLGPIGSYIALALATCAILATADTEIFLLASMSAKIVCFDNKGDSNGRSPGRLLPWLLIGVSIAACCMAVWTRDAAKVYTWILMLIVALAPATLAALFGQKSRWGLLIIGVPLTAILILGPLGFVTLETIYLVPSVALLVTLLLGCRHAAK